MAKGSLNVLSGDIIGAMIEVHKEIGPGFLENVYHKALEQEFAYQEIPFESEKEIKVCYKGKEIGLHRLDFLIDNEIVIELKTVDQLHKKHYSQVRAYLKAIDKKVGLLVNFSEFKLDPRRITIND